MIVILVGHEWKKDFPCQNLSWVLWFLIEHLIAEPNDAFHSILYVLNIFFTIFDIFFFSESIFHLSLNQLYKEMTSSSNQKRNLWNNFVLPNWQFEFTIVLSDIKYFLYGTHFFFPSFLGSKCLWRCSYVGGCVMSDVEVVYYESMLRNVTLGHSIYSVIFLTMGIHGSLFSEDRKSVV